MATRPQLEGYRPVKRRRPAGNRGLKRARSQVRDALHALPAELREDIETPACPWEDIPAPAYLMPPPELPRAVGERVLIDGARAKIVKVSRKDGHKLKVRFSGTKQKQWLLDTQIDPPESHSLADAWRGLEDVHADRMATASVLQSLGVAWTPANRAEPPVRAPPGPPHRPPSAPHSFVHSSIDAPATTAVAGSAVESGAAQPAAAADEVEEGGGLSAGRWGRAHSRGVGTLGQPPRCGDKGVSEGADRPEEDAAEEGMRENAGNGPAVSGAHGALEAHANGGAPGSGDRRPERAAASVPTGSLRSLFLQPAIFSLFGPADGEEDEAAGGSALPQPQPFLLGSVPHDAARTEALAGSTRQPVTTAGTASAVRQEGAAAGSAPAARAEAELEPVLFMRTHTEDELTVQWQQRRQQGFKDFKSKHKTDVRQALKRKRQLALRGGQGARGKQRVLRATSHRR